MHECAHAHIQYCAWLMTGLATMMKIGRRDGMNLPHTHALHIAYCHGGWQLKRSNDEMPSAGTQSELQQRIY